MLKILYNVLVAGAREAALNIQGIYKVFIAISQCY